ncbi:MULTISPECIES: Rrf2 family transcriptional regulator [Paenibacillus]|uniref:Rrf2 family transcriptional regulator n=1 Tax=Paenibacillus TaxID=44249 RepID=UPI0022B8602C|nr:Rrf2 family transcriptional regulator [Paenibacillus caseinilyticus]MCZ8523209.1 Rrf2 family transcriptional regulator [Paenibacillus caseinilyticus]
MSASSQFSVATHILCFLAIKTSGRTTSELLGLSAGANPAVIRRMMRKLSQAGLIVSTLGTHATITLALTPESITMLDVFRAVSDGKRQELFLLHREPNPLCLIGSRVPDVLPIAFGRIQSAMEEEMARITIADLAKQIEESMGG